jgi:hypothetical protein
MSSRSARAAKPGKAVKQIVAFKVEPELASLLDAMPNKSEFIRSAIQSRLSSVCPLCRGSGVAPYGAVTDDLTRLVQQHPLVVCGGCGVREPRPCHTPGHCEGDRRLDAFERFGAYYCDACFATVATCEDCGRPLGSKRRGEKSRARCEACKAA